jgi:Lytic transglycolase
MVLRRLRTIFTQRSQPSEDPSPLFGLDASETQRIGTQDDPLRGFEVAMERHEYTAASPYYPMGTILRVCYVDCTVVRVNDRGPYIAGRELDLSAIAAEDIGLAPVGADVVDVEVLEE